MLASFPREVAAFRVRHLKMELFYQNLSLRILPYVSLQSWGLGPMRTWQHHSSKALASPFLPFLAYSTIVLPFAMQHTKWVCFGLDSYWPNLWDMQIVLGICQCALLLRTSLRRANPLFRASHVYCCSSTFCEFDASGCSETMRSLLRQVALLGAALVHGPVMYSAIAATGRARLAA